MATKRRATACGGRCSPNKQTVTADLSHPDGREILLGLVKTADVLVESFRPGVLERWGLGPEELHRVNEGLVILRMTGFGQTGPYASRRAFGTLIEAMSGFAHMTGTPDGPPTLPPFGLADGLAGMAGAFAIMCALRDREVRTGRGRSSTSRCLSRSSWFLDLLQPSSISSA